MRRQRFFISYCGSDGLTFAQKLCNALVNDFVLWLYENHRVLGGSTWRDIAVNLIKSDGVIVINTPDSMESEGQKRECGIALNNDKPIYILKDEKSRLLPELSFINWFSFSESNCSDKFSEFRDKLVWLTDKEGQLEETKKIEIPASIKQRQEILSKLRDNIEGLDPDKVKEHAEIILRNYQTGSIAASVATKSLLDRVINLDMTSYTRINLYQNIDKKEYLDPSYIWDSFFADVGRSIKRGEQRYLFETMLKQCGKSNTTFLQNKNDFPVIVDEAKRLAAAGFKPTVLIAPIHFMTSFVHSFHNNIDWQTGGKILNLEDGIRLQLISSNIYAPLDDFILTSPESGQWIVIPELNTRNELPIALGNSIDDPENKVAFFVDLIAKYELMHREGVSLIHVVT